MKAWKIQKFASDLVYDMRSRNLLPLAVLLLVAMLAAPFLIKGSATDTEPATPATAVSSSPPPEAMSAVVAYEPGLREYKRRLDELNPKNPFRQQFSASAEAAAAAVDESSGGFEIDPGSVASSGAGAGSGGGGGTGGGGGGGGGGGAKPAKVKTETKYVYYETDVLAGESGTALQRRNRVPLFGYLPSDQVPVAVYMGPAAGGTQAIFLVSEAVTGIGGDGVCFPDPEACQLLGLKRGQGADLAYNGRNYRIEVVRIQRRTSSKPPG